MLARNRNTPLTPSGAAPTRSGAEHDAAPLGAIERLQERLPAWPFRAAAAVTALTAAWFAMVLLGGLPRGVVEWIVTGMFAAFAYTMGYILTVLFACLVACAWRSSTLFLLAGGLAAFGLLAAQGSV